jgi:hypothetical protein
MEWKIYAPSVPDPVDPRLRLNGAILFDTNLVIPA